MAADVDTVPQDPLREFLDVMRRLRRDCAWKASQTHASLVRHLLEEAHEAAEAMESGDPEHLREELGDLMLQVWFHAVIAEEAGEFTLDDVARDITAKMHRRNPHVFGAVDGSALTPDQVNELWQEQKRLEKGRQDPVDGLPTSLPALLWAEKVLDRLERAGTQPVEADGDDLGERLLALVEEGRRDGVDPEQALRAAVRRRLNA